MPLKSNNSSVCKRLIDCDLGRSFILLTSPEHSDYRSKGTEWQGRPLSSVEQGSRPMSPGKAEKTQEFSGIKELALATQGRVADVVCLGCVCAH